VLTLLVSVAAAAVFIRLTMVSENWKIAYDAQLTRAQIADLSAANLKIALSGVNNKLSASEIKLQELKDALAKAEQTHTAFKATSAEKEAVQSGHYDSLKASFVELEESLKASLAMQKQLSDEKAALSKSLETANEIARGLKKDLDELTVTNRRLERLIQHYAVLIKDLKEEIEEVREELAAAKAGGGTKGTGDGDKAPVTSDQPVHGTVTAVADGVASINIGQAKGIRKNMMLTVYRGGKFVAHLRIDMVESDTAAGVILDSQLDVMQGDKVATSLK